MDHNLGSIRPVLSVQDGLILAHVGKRLWIVHEIGNDDLIIVILGNSQHAFSFAR